MLINRQTDSFSNPTRLPAAHAKKIQPSSTPPSILYSTAPEVAWSRRRCDSRVEPCRDGIRLQGHGGRKQAISYASGKRTCRIGDNVLLEEWHFYKASHGNSGVWRSYWWRWFKRRIICRNIGRTLLDTNSSCLASTRVSRLTVWTIAKPTAWLSTRRLLRVPKKKI